MSKEAILIPLAGMATLPILVGLVMVLKQARRDRQWRHEERMKALELGRPVPDSEIWSARAAIALGAVMPIAVFGVAWLTTLTTRADEEAWFAAAVVGIAGVIGGVRLAKAGQAADEIEEIASPAPRFRKPPFNPDAHDAIVHRG